MSDAVSLVVGPKVPEGVALYPPQPVGPGVDPNAPDVAQATLFLKDIHPGALMKFTLGKKRLVVKTMPAPANAGSWMVQVSQKSLDKLRESKAAGSQLNDVQWTGAKYRDLIKYSSEHRWRLISALLATLSTMGVLVKEIFGASFDEKGNATVVVIVIVAAVFVFAKEIVGAIRDFCASREPDTT
jgi:hypothetical protein